MAVKYVHRRDVTLGQLEAAPPSADRRRNNPVTLGASLRGGESNGYDTDDCARLPVKAAPLARGLARYLTFYTIYAS